MMANKEIPDWQLERYLLGELSADLEKEIKYRLTLDTSLQNRVQALKDSNRDILAIYTPEIQAGQIEKKYEKSRDRQKREKQSPGRQKLRSVAYALSTAAVILIVLIPLRNMLRQPSSQDREEIRLKGLSPRLVVYRKSGNRIMRLEDGEAAAPGDVIQLSYVAAGKTHGVIYSLDGRGIVTLHFPGTSQNTSPELDQRGEISLPYAYQLDDAPAYERFFFVTAEQSFELAVVRDAVEKLASKPKRADRKRLRLPPGFTQYSTLLRKEEY